MESQAVLGRVYYRVRFRKLAEITVLLPLASLLVCFITAMVFQYKEVNTTVCDVYNFIPSISAITGISPQRYIWRIGVAFHCTPRLLIASVYHSYYISMASNLDPKDRCRYLKWVKINYWLNLSENLSLVGVTYISNKENYPIHEKLFIIFMFSSLSYMLLNCIIYRWGNPSMPKEKVKSYRTKVTLLFIKLISTIGLLFFFYRHRRFCEELAFSYFAFCEYCMAVANMAYHVTVMWDCPDEFILVGAPLLKMGASNPGTPTKENTTSTQFDTTIDTQTQPVTNVDTSSSTSNTLSHSKTD